MKYEQKLCTFRFEHFELIIEVIENRDHVSVGDMDYIHFPNARDCKDSVMLLKGTEFDENKQIYFYIERVDQVNIKTYRAKTYAYIVFEEDEAPVVDCLQIAAEELNWFYNVRQAYTASHVFTDRLELKLKPFEETRKNFQFEVDGQSIQAEFNIARRYKGQATTPIELQTILNYDFSPLHIQDLELIERLT